ncbi:MAG: glycosyltransferase family 9 protein [Patescibacteria group bacterium]|nr:glycosyltransferase family 9 protein [Patescibacteria group bacterium]
MKIAVFRALKLGDLLCCVPALRSLRRAYPKAEITLIGLPWAKDFALRFNHLIDKFVEFPGYPGLRESAGNLRGIVKFVTQMQEENFDLVIQMHGNGKVTNSLIRSLRPQLEAGYWKGEVCPNPQTFMRYVDNQHEIKRHLMLMKFLGIEPQGADLEFPIKPSEKRQFQENIDQWKLETGNFVVIHSGAYAKRRRWPAQRFAQVADYLAGLGYQIVLTGVEEEKEIISAVLKEMLHPAVNLAGKTDLGQLGMIIKNARVLVSNDTGVSHLAAAVKTPSVIISYLKNPNLWAPLNQDLHRVLQAKEAEDISQVFMELDLLLNIHWRRGIAGFPRILSV